MVDLAFTVLDAAPEPYGAAPTLLFRVRVTESTGAAVHAVALRAQVHIEPQRRQYAPAESDGVADLFGPTERWGSTLRPFLWTHVSTVLRGFTGDLDFDLPMPCTYDFEVAATKYLHSLRRRGRAAGAALHRHRLHPGRHRLRRGAGAVAPGGGVPDAGAGVASS